MHFYVAVNKVFLRTPPPPKKVTCLSEGTVFLGGFLNGHLGKV